MLERGILLFIDHDQPQTGERRKYREPRAEHDIGATAVGEEPSADALQFSHGARLRDDARARESVAKRGLQGGSERYLGYENQDLFAAGEDFRSQLEIDLCLTAAGDSKEEAHPEFLQSAAQNADRLPLLGGQFVRVDETGLGPLRLDRSDPTRFNAAPQQVPAPPRLRGEFGCGCPALRKPRKQCAQAPVPRWNRRKRVGSCGREGVVARRIRNGPGAAQPRRQSGSDDLAQRAPIVVAAEFREFHPLAPKRRDLAQDSFGRAEPRCRHLGLGGELDDQSDQAFLAERHQYSAADVRPGCVLRPVVEQLRERNVECDANDHFF